MRNLFKLENVIANIALIALFAFTMNANAIDWNPIPDESYTKTQKILAAGFVVANLMDISQTVYALEGCRGKCEGRYKEGNPLLGEQPSRGTLIAIKAVGVYGVMTLLKNTQPEYRTLSLVLANAVITSVVISNGSQPMVGFRIGF